MAGIDGCTAGFSLGPLLQILRIAENAHRSRRGAQAGKRNSSWPSVAFPDGSTYAYQSRRKAPRRLWEGPGTTLCLERLLRSNGKAGKTRLTVRSNGRAFPRACRNRSLPS